MNHRLSTCRSVDCGASIIWALNPATGKRVPLDAKPTGADDRLVVSHRFQYILTGPEECRPVTVDEWNDVGVEVRCSHFRTCKDVGRWSKGNPNGAAQSRPNNSAEN